MGWFWKGIAGGTVSHIWSVWILPTLPAFGASLMTLLLGLLGHEIPLMYVWVATLAAFAFTATGVLRTDEWIERRRVDSKLSYANIELGLSQTPGGVSLGFRLRSKAAFPLEFEVTEIRSRIANRVPSQQYNLSQVYLIPPEGDGWFRDAHIDVADLIQANSSLLGTIQFRVRYGRPGKRKFSLEGKKRIVLPFDGSKNLLSNGAVTDEA